MSTKSRVKNATKVDAYGLHFRSKLELYTYEAFMKAGIHLDQSFGRGDEAEAVAADHHSGMHHHQIADHAAVHHGDIGIEQAFRADLHLMADVAPGADHGAGADLGAALDHGVGADRDAFADLGVVGDDRARVDPGDRLRRLFGEGPEHDAEGVIDIVADDEGAVARFAGGEVAADQNDPGRRGVELFLVAFAGNEGEVAGARVADPVDAGDLALRIALDLAFDHFGDPGGGEGELFHDLENLPFGVSGWNLCRFFEIRSNIHAVGVIFKAHAGAGAGNLFFGGAPRRCGAPRARVAETRLDFLMQNDYIDTRLCEEETRRRRFDKRRRRVFMKFIHPQLFWLVPPVLLAVIVLGVSATRRRRKGLRLLLGRRAGSPEALRLSMAARRWRRFLLGAAAFFLIAAAARPSWSSRMIPGREHCRDILVIFDVSKSMLATDLPPSRLDHAKYLLRELVRENRGDRFALVAFAGEAFLACPFTSDAAAFDQYVDELNPDLVPVGGTDLEKALRTALAAFRTAGGHRGIVLFTDGDELSGDSRRVLASLHRQKIPIMVVGLGDPATATPLPDADGKLRRDADGRVITSRLNEEALKRLAAESGGIYLRAGVTDTGLAAVTERLRALERAESGEGPKRR